VASKRPIPGLILGGAPALEKRVYNIILLGLPFVGSVVALVFAPSLGFTPATAVVFLLFYGWTALGGTLGLHRYFSHRSFKASRPVAILLAMGATFTMQGPIARWVADHRRHHWLEEHEDAPHSPYTTAGGQQLSRLIGLIHAYFKWMFDGSVSDPEHFCPELLRDRVVMHFQRHFWLYALLSLALPGTLGWMLGGRQEAMRCLLWAGCGRVFLIQQATFTVNSLGHSFGPQEFTTRDSSRNLWPFSILLLGDGYHNNHHAFPRSARIALLPGEIDPGHAALRFLERLGLVSDILVPTPEAILERRLRHPGATSE